LWELIHLLDKIEFGNRIKIPKQEWRACNGDECWIRNYGNFEHAMKEIIILKFSI